jgi:hypothetical protein
MQRIALRTTVLPTDADAAPSSSSGMAQPKSIALQATLAFLFGRVPDNTIDRLGAAWGIAAIVAGTNACKQAAHKQTKAVHAIRMRYAAHMPPTDLIWLELSLNILIDEAARRAAPSIADVRRWLQWDLAYAPTCGALGAFLHAAGLVDANKDAATTKRPAVGHQTPATDASFAVEDATLLKIPREMKTAFLQRRTLPLVGAIQRKADRLQRAAVDEILSAMPSKRVPMYIGDLGQLIGVWTKFNARYESRLAYSLTEFLLSNPESFKVVDNVVMRTSESKADQVRVRFDDEQWSGSDDDEGPRAAKKRRLEDAKKAAEAAKFGTNKTLSSKAKKRRLKSMLNKSKFNKNRRQLAQDARVPGFVKPLPRKVSGRGKKKNARVWKRGEV